MPENEREPFSHIAKYYEGLIRRYGHDPRACDYGRPESQQIKFRVLSEVMPLSHRSVLDIGCGFADFARFLQERFEGVRYSGIDLCDAMIAQARKDNPNLDVRVGNILDLPAKGGVGSGETAEGTFDLVTANGIFYLLGQDAWPTMQSMVRRMFALAKCAVAFNSLSAWAGDQEAGEFYADPLITFSFCRTITPWVTLRHDYHSRDFTIYLYRTRNA